MSGINVEVWHNMERDTVEMRISVPFRQYAGSLWPNETLRESVQEAFDKFLAERRG
ncbi:hypothetical protein [Xanthomonas phage f30-Xaj]|uniref:Uncharacterized protein n=1 Tax=Xanthomonas phage f30-Xaj TaxID=1784981 RepID=A0A127AYE5_9CAUD|nr:hypothetical protein FDI08_gp15 [Xanthomonas phage f30-Xaj]AMM44731.1 hypothetical protein [Xanthomonas phage f30-Xaj]